MLMRTGISKVVMCVATFMLLLMSAIPHHHHCTEADTFRHIDYICFADNGAIEGDACDDCNSDHEVNHDMAQLAILVVVGESLEQQLQGIRKRVAQPQSL